MQDLLYIVTLGFAGSDIWRAVICAFFTAMLVNKNAGVWAMGGVALFIDRAVWPLLEQSFAGAKTETIYASLTALAQTLVPNLGLYSIRYLGIVIMVSVFLILRKRLHGSESAKKAAAA